MRFTAKMSWTEYLASREAGSDSIDFPSKQPAPDYKRFRKSLKGAEKDAMKAAPSQSPVPVLSTLELPETCDIDVALPQFGITSGFRVVGSASFDAAGAEDYLVTDTVTGQVEIWRTSTTGQKIARYILPPVPIGWSLSGFCDMNGTGSADLVFRQIGGAGEIGIWYLDFVSNSISYGVLTTAVVDQAWLLRGAFRYGGQPHLLWRNPSTGVNAIWVLSGLAISTVKSLPSTTSEWILGGVGDFNGNGLPDLFWRNTVTGENAVWQLNANLGFAAGLFSTTVTDQSWQVSGCGSVGLTPAVFWKYSGTAANPVRQNAAWLMSVATVTSTALVPPNITSNQFGFTSPNWHSAGGNGIVSYSQSVSIATNTPLLRDQTIVSSDFSFPLDLVQAQETILAGRTGQDVIVAVVDSGVNTNHPDLVGRFWVNPIDGTNGFNSVTGLTTGLYDPAQQHGTKVAGVIASNFNAIGHTGGAPGVKLMVIRATLADKEVFTWESLSNGILWALARGAKVINCSFQADLGTSQASFTDPSFQSALDAAAAANAVVVIGAGNRVAPIDLQYPANQSTRSNVLSVVGVTSNGAFVSDYCHAGLTVRNVVAAPTLSNPTTEGDGYGTIAGTSGATPVVSALAAVLLAAVPTATAPQIKDWILQGCNFNNFHLE